MTYGTLNLFGRDAADLLMAPLARLPDAVGLGLLSLLAALLAVGALRVLTPQPRLRLLGEGMSAAVYEMRLFLGSPGRVLRAQGRFLALGLASMGLSLPALVATAPAFAALLARADLRHGMRPLAPGEEAIVRIDLRLPAPARETIGVEAAPGLAIRPPVVIVPGAGVVWVALRATAPGLHGLRVHAGGRTETKLVRVAESGDARAARERLSPVRTTASDPRLWRSDEPPLDGESPIAAIEVTYPARETSVPWWLAILFLSMACAVALRRPLGVSL